VRGEIFRTCPDRPWGPPSLLYNGYRVFPGGKEWSGRNTYRSPLLVPWSRKSRAIPLLPLWAVRPSQSLGACTRLHFFTRQNIKFGAMCPVKPSYATFFRRREQIKLSQCSSIYRSALMETACSTSDCAGLSLTTQLKCSALQYP
jgi:hypothetical protein